MWRDVQSLLSDIACPGSCYFRGRGIVRVERSDPEPCTRQRRFEEWVSSHCVGARRNYRETPIRVRRGVIRTLFPSHLKQ
jgi:hypothetical protein